VTAFALIIRPL